MWMLCLWLWSCVGEPPRPTLPEPEPEPVPPAAPVDVAVLKGRKVWMVNASAPACEAATGLGLEVSCESDRPGAAEKEIVAWCPEIPLAALAALRSRLRLNDFQLRSWETQPDEADAGECGEFYEITIRF